MFPIPPPVRHREPQKEAQQDRQSIRSREHLTLMLCGASGCGKSTTAGHLLFELGELDERQMDGLRQESAAMGKPTMAYAFHTDTLKTERERGKSISCSFREFYTDKWHYTLIDAPGHRNFIKNMMAGASQADVAVLFVPADSTFAESVQKEDTKRGRIQGQSRQHARLLHVLGIKNLIVAINKMDCTAFSYEHERFLEVKRETMEMLIQVGFSRSFVVSSVPFIPISGWEGDNLVTVSENTPWWLGTREGQPTSPIGGYFEGFGASEEPQAIAPNCMTLLETLDECVAVPKRFPQAPLRMPISAVVNHRRFYPIVIGRIEQGTLKLGDDVVFRPTHRPGVPCGGKVFSIEQHHQRLEEALPGDTVGVCIKGVDKSSKPQVGDVMALAKDVSLRGCASFNAQVQLVEHVPGQIRPGFECQAFVRTGHASCRLTRILWKVGLSSSGVRVDHPQYLVAEDRAEIELKPLTSFVCEPRSVGAEGELLRQSNGMSTVAFLESNSIVMSGKITRVEQRQEAAPLYKGASWGKAFKKADQKLDDEAARTGGEAGQAA